jgi:hypothetical protein
MDLDNEGTKAEEDCSVCVAVKIRPMVASEQEQGGRSTLAVAGGQQVRRSALPWKLVCTCKG